MVAAEERLKVLKMVQDGKISAQDALQLLDALDGNRPVETETSQETPPPNAERAGRWFRVRVTDTDTGRARVNVRLPVNLVNAGIKMGANLTPDIHGLDPDLVLEFIRKGQVGQVIDIMDETDGERVEVFIE